MLCPPGVRTKKSGTMNLNPRNQKASPLGCSASCKVKPKATVAEGLFAFKEQSHPPASHNPSPSPAAVGGGDQSPFPAPPLSPGWPLVLTPFPSAGSAWSGRLAHGVVCVHWLVKKNKHRSKLRPFLSSRAPPPAREMQTAGIGGGWSLPWPPRASCGWEGWAG